MTPQTVTSFIKPAIGDNKTLTRSRPANRPPSVAKAGKASVTGLGTDSVCPRSGVLCGSAVAVARGVAGSVDTESNEEGIGSRKRWALPLSSGWWAGTLWSVG